MKNNKLSKLENVYYYGIHRYFWHGLILVSGIILMASIAVILWTFTPTSKREVQKPPQPVKPDYPRISKVNTDEVIAIIRQKKKQEQKQSVKQVKKQSKQTDIKKPEELIFEAPEKTEKSIDSTALKNFYTQLGETKALIDPTLYPGFWNDKYKNTFRSERDRKMYRKTKDPSLVVKVLVNPGFKKRYENFTEKHGYDSYREKAGFLKILNGLLEAIDDTNRVDFVEKYFFKLRLRNYPPSVLQNKFNLIGNIIRHIPSEEQLETYTKLWNFWERNPNDGEGLIRYSGKILPRLDPGVRLRFIVNMQNEYIRHYNNNLSALIQATDGFVPMLEQMLIPEWQAEALNIYYGIYRKNNIERNRKIKEIDKDYAEALQQWEENYQLMLNKAQADYMRKKMKKQSFRSVSLKSLGTAFVAIMLLIIILLHVSMVRNVNRLTEALYEHNRSGEGKPTKE